MATGSNMGFLLSPCGVDINCRRCNYLLSHSYTTFSQCICLLQKAAVKGIAKSLQVTLITVGNNMCFRTVCLQRHSGTLSCKHRKWWKCSGRKRKKRQNWEKFRRRYTYFLTLTHLASHCVKWPNLSDYQFQKVPNTMRISTLISTS